MPAKRAIILSPDAYRQGISHRYWREVDRSSMASADAVRVNDEDREAAWQRFWAIADRIQEHNADKDPDEVYHAVTEVVEEVRQERYERERAAKGGSLPTYDVTRCRDVDRQVRSRTEFRNLVYVVTQVIYESACIVAPHQETHDQLWIKADTSWVSYLGHTSP